MKGGDGGREREERMVGRKVAWRKRRMVGERGEGEKE